MRDLRMMIGIESGRATYVRTGSVGIMIVG